MRSKTAIALMAIGAAFGACGGDEVDAETPEAAVESYFRAISEADGERACGLLTDAALEGSAVAGVPASGEDCVTAVNGLGESPEPSEISTETLVETGNEATVKVSVETAGQQTTPFAVQLVKDGDTWKIESLALSAVQ